MLTREYISDAPVHSIAISKQNSGPVPSYQGNPETWAIGNNGFVSGKRVRSTRSRDVNHWRSALEQNPSSRSKTRKRIFGRRIFFRGGAAPTTSPNSVTGWRLPTIFWKIGDKLLWSGEDISQTSSCLTGAAFISNEGWANELYFLRD